MPTPFDFPTSTPKLGLPFLFSGQAQKEFFVNQAFALVDALLQQCVVSSGNVPPTAPSDGDVYRVIAPAGGDWVGEEDSLAVRIGGAWHFVRPANGMRIYDQAAAQWLVFKVQWESASTPAVPTGGTVVDTEARAAIDGLVTELSRLGILA